MTGVQTCALPICFPVTIGERVVCLQGGVEERVYNNFKAKERMIAALNDGHKSIADFLTDDDVNMDEDETTNKN